MELSETLLKGAYIVSHKFDVVYIQELDYYISFWHVKAKEITVKPSTMKGHTFSNTTYSKVIRFHFIMQYQSFPWNQKWQTLSRVLWEADDPAITVLCLKAMASLYVRNLIL